MAYGIQLFNDDGSLQWDSSTTGGGVIVDSVIIPVNTSSTRSYPAFAGRELIVLTSFVSQFFTNNYVSPTISYSSGYPIVTFHSNPLGGTYILAVR